MNSVAYDVMMSNMQTCTRMGRDALLVHFVQAAEQPSNIHCISFISAYQILNYSSACRCFQCECVCVCLPQRLLRARAASTVTHRHLPSHTDTLRLLSDQFAIVIFCFVLMHLASRINQFHGNNAVYIKICIIVRVILPASVTISPYIT